MKTGDDWVIEFQHSYIKPEERRSREGFYPKLVWVVDGLRRKRDEAGLRRAWEESATPFGTNAPVRLIWSQEGALLRDWVGSRAHVFFDLGDEQVLWWLLPYANDVNSYVTRISRTAFIETHRRTTTKGANDFDSFAEELIGLVADNESPRRAQLSVRGQRDFVRMSKKPLQGHFRRRRYRL